VSPTVSVKTAEDFGSQGDAPVNQELLDWLACEFMTAWDVKALHWLIVTSAAYRQLSRVTPQLLERDPDNRLLARGPRYRLNAHALRDQALAASGLLVERIGGPPVNPYQPPGSGKTSALDKSSTSRTTGRACTGGAFTRSGGARSDRRRCSTRRRARCAPCASRAPTLRCSL
jgi:hypothetical protein